MDVNGTFLLGGFEDNPITHEKQELYLGVPQGFMGFLPEGDWVILLMKTLYGCKQSVKRFWLFLLGLFQQMGYQYNRVDPCLYYKFKMDQTRLGSVDELD